MLSEGRKRDAAANAVLALSFAANAAQSPQAFVSSGEKAAPSLPLMGELMRKRKEANRNLDSARVSEPARNRKKKNFSESKRLKKWWNKGRNERVPNENKASWKELMDDDRKQLTRTDTSFKKGETGVKGWRPHKAFSPRMIKTGPTPAVRQAFERPVRAVSKIFNKEDIQSSKMKTFKKFLEEATIIREGRHFSSKDELMKHHGGKLPDGTFIKNRGTKEAPKYGLASVQSRENEKERREKRIKQATGQLTPGEKAKVERKRKLARRRGAELHHATEIETSGKEMKNMSPGDVLRHKKKQAQEKKYHGNDPKNLVVANKGPVSKFKPQQPGFHHGKFHAFERGNREKLSDISNAITPMRAFTTLVNKARRKTRRGED